MSRRLPTGIGALDRKLGGGMPSGALVMLSASPASQSEQFLSDLTEARRTLVMTTRRPRSAVEQSIRATSTRPENVAVREVELDAPLEHIYSLVERLDGETNLVIDPLDPLERIDEARFVHFLNALRASLSSIDSVAVFHCLDGASVPEIRDITTYMVDIVFDITTTVQGDYLENRLAVPKFRGGHPFEETIRLELADGVGIDTSRDIG